MSLQAPRLDDRSFNDIVEEALRLIPLYCPEWTDHNPSDPGITLVELFAWMTDILLYRLNRVPEKHYIKFMELIGMSLQGAEPARVPITFWLTAPQPATVQIPPSTAVATIRTEVDPAITFTTDEAAVIRVPKLRHVMTSGASRLRDFNEQNLRQVQSGFTEFAMFPSDPPAPDDALYLGFEEDLSHHIAGISIEVDQAEGAGISLEHPPYVWEVQAAEQEAEWIAVEVEPVTQPELRPDGIRAFNTNGTIRLHLPAMQRDTRGGFTAFWLRCRMLGEEEASGPIYRISPRIRRLNAESWGVTVRASNVSEVRNEVLGRSDGTPGQRFYLTHTPVAPRRPGEYLVVRSDDNTEKRWEEVSDFSDSTPNDRHYVLDSLSGEIRLAPALPQRDGSIRRYGAIAEKDSMLEMRAYRYGGGQIGNVGKDSLSVLKTALPYVERVTNRVAAQGGLDAEELQDAKERVPGFLRSLGRAVTPSDFEHLAFEAAPGSIARAYCAQPANGTPGEVLLLIIPTIAQFQGYIAPESLRLKPELSQQVYDFLDDRRLLSTRLTIIEPEYQWVQTEVTLRMVSRGSSQAVREAVESALFDYLNPLIGGEDGKGWPFGRALSIGDIFVVLRDVPGVELVRSVKIFPVNAEGSAYAIGEETDEIRLNPIGTIVSFGHEVIVET